MSPEEEQKHRSNWSDYEKLVMSKLESLGRHCHEIRDELKEHNQRQQRHSADIMHIGHEVRRLDDDAKWLWRITVGAVIVALIGVGVSIVSSPGDHSESQRVEDRSE